MPRKRTVLLGGLFAASIAALVTCDGRLSAPDSALGAAAHDGARDSSHGLAPGWDANVDPGDVTLPDPEIGWRYLPELPGCDAQVPIVPQASMKPLVWIACPSGKAECLRFDTTGWREDLGPGVITDARVSLDKKWLAFVRPLSGGKSAEFDLYDRTNLSPVNTWLWVWPRRCHIHPVLGASRVTLFVDTFTDSPTRIAYASGPIPSAALQPTFLTLQPQPKLQWVTPNASDTKIAFEVSGGLGIDTVKLGETTFTHAHGNKWFDPLVVGSDVFASNEYGSTGWNRELRINPDGTSTVFREVQGRHVDAFHTDGSTWFWLEEYGDSDYTHFVQPRAEVWSAPYTSDPAALAATARKLAQVDGATNGDIAFDGYFAIHGPNGTTYVVRASDGAVNKVDVPVLYGPGPPGVPELRIQHHAFVSKDEIWGELRGKNGSPDDLGFAKFQLGSWP